MAEPEFISEPIDVPRGAFDASAMATGLAGTPRAFIWRGQEHRIAEVLARTKVTSPEGGKEGNEVYLRREAFTVRLEDGRIAEIYMQRQGPRRRANPSRPPRRWFLYTITPRDSA